MPAWITHLATAEKLMEDIHIQDKNSFLFGNIMPDILNNYIVKQTHLHINYEVSHFAILQMINHRNFALPGTEKFLWEYHKNIDNPVILGFYTHLLTDYFWNTITYENFFFGHNNCITVKFSDGMQKDYTYDDAIHMKHRDFGKFSGYLKNMYSLQPIEYAEKLCILSNEVKGTPLTREDIQKTIEVLKESLQNSTVKEDTSYFLFSEDSLMPYFEQSIEFIKKSIKDFT